LTDEKEIFYRIFVIVKYFHFSCLG